MDIRLQAEDALLKSKFYTLENATDVADLLEIEVSILNYHLYHVPLNRKYSDFVIQKKSGGERCISIPNDGLKILQQKLNYILQLIYKPKNTIHGFVKERSIVTNAKAHLKKKYVFNIDLKDFFPSINFGRVRGMFMGVPYNIPPKAATILAQICCFKNMIPQGAPTSPIISNMICSKLDSELRRFAIDQKCRYTRYADDLTFSTTRSKFPTCMAIVGDDSVHIGDELNKIIEDNGFFVNDKKTRLRTKRTRQEVTGLTINKFPNVPRKFVRQTRSMLHSWEKYGEELAQKEFWGKYDTKYRPYFSKYPSFKKVVKGRIDFLRMVRGKSDHIYKKMLRKYAELDPEFHYSPQPDLVGSGSNPRIMTEGKTDWKHIKTALKKLNEDGLFNELKIDFDEYGDDKAMGDAELLRICETLIKTPNQTKTICIFDRDNAQIINKITDNSNEFQYKSWGSQVYSFGLPIPDHRIENPEISIEFYYKDSEIKRKDKNNRRLFLGNEFQNTTWHNSEELVCKTRNKVGKANAIIDNEVFNKPGENVALSKSDFAEYIYEGEDNFNDFDFTEFAKIFEVIKKIIEV
jgi:RNA-directed DNA polymerase